MKILLFIIVVFSFHSYANIPVPHLISFLSVEESIKENYTACIKFAQGFEDRKACGDELVKQFMNTREKQSINDTGGELTGTTNK